MTLSGILDRVKSESMGERGFEHLQMNVGILVAGEADIAHLALLYGIDQGFHTATRSENAGGVGVADHFMELQKVNPVGLQALERFVKLLGGCLLRLAVNLGHEEGFFAIAVAQCLAHANFARAAVVVPTVVEEVDAGVERSANDADTRLLIGLHAEVIAAQTDDRNSFARTSKAAHGNRGIRCACQPMVERSHESGCGGSLDEASAIHERLLGIRRRMPGSG